MSEFDGLAILITIYFMIILILLSAVNSKIDKLK